MCKMVQSYMMWNIQHLNSTLINWFQIPSLPVFRSLHHWKCKSRHQTQTSPSPRTPPSPPPPQSPAWCRYCLLCEVATSERVIAVNSHLVCPVHCYPSQSVSQAARQPNSLSGPDCTWLVSVVNISIRRYWNILVMINKKLFIHKDISWKYFY